MSRSPSTLTNIDTKISRRTIVDAGLSKDARSRPPLVGPVDLVMSTVLLLDYRKGLAIPKSARVLYIHTVIKIELVKRLHRHYLCKLRLRPLRSLKMCLLAES